MFTVHGQLRNESNEAGGGTSRKMRSVTNASGSVSEFVAEEGEFEDLLCGQNLVALRLFKV
jgi:hypothetical protein